MLPGGTQSVDTIKSAFWGYPNLFTIKFLTVVSGTIPTNEAHIKIDSGFAETEALQVFAINDIINGNHNSAVAFYNLSNPYYIPINGIPGIISNIQNNIFF